MLRLLKRDAITGGKESQPPPARDNSFFVASLDGI